MNSKEKVKTESPLSNVKLYVDGRVTSLTSKNISISTFINLYIFSSQYTVIVYEKYDTFIF